MRRALALTVLCLLLLPALLAAAASGSAAATRCKPVGARLHDCCPRPAASLDVDCCVGDVPIAPRPAAPAPERPAPVALLPPAGAVSAPTPLATASAPAGEARPSHELGARHSVLRR